MSQNRDWDIGQSVSEVEDRLCELADEACPIYNGDIIDMVSNNSDISHREVEVPAFDGSMTPINVCAAAIYEYLSEIAYEVLMDVKCDVEEAAEGIDEYDREATAEAAKDICDVLGLSHDWIDNIVEAHCGPEEDEDGDD